MRNSSPRFEWDVFHLTPYSRFGSERLPQQNDAVGDGVDDRLLWDRSSKMTSTKTVLVKNI